MSRHSKIPDPPLAREFPFKHQHHGITREDPWHWLRERDNPEVLAHLKAENAYTESWFERTGNLRETLYEELIGRIEESNRSAIYPKGDYLYQSRIRKGEDYRAYYRKPRAGDGDWALYFDANREARGQVYFDLGFLDVSPDGRLLAYSVDTAGEESYTLFFRDLETGENLPVSIENTCADGEWAATGSVFYFVKEDETRRPDRIFRYRLGDPPESAELVYSEPDPLYTATVGKSQDEQYLLAISESKETTEVHTMEAAKEDAAFELLFPRRHSIQYSVDHHEGNWLVRTNEEAPDFRLLRVPVGAQDLSAAETVVDGSDVVRLNDFLVLKDFLLLFERTGGLDRIRVMSMRDGNSHLIAMRDPVYDLQESVNAEFDTCFFNFTVSSPIRPSSTFRYNLETRGQQLLRQVTVPSGHNPDQYTVYRIDAPAEDGTRVPVTVIHAKRIRKDGRAPLYLYGYGAYGETVEPAFRTAWLTWLERGFVVAIAHVRGGGLLGESWYQEGKLEFKENSFSDFISCAEHLIAEGYSQPGHILVEGGSAGGLLVGAVLNLRPELFKAAVAAVPFVDVASTMMDPSLPLTTIEYEEWGNPEHPDVFRRILGYSPYDNVREAEYPALLATAGFNDPRVPYWEAAKWVAKLRKCQTGKAPILLKTNLDTGHGGASGRYAFWKEIADEQAFLLWNTARG